MRVLWLKATGSYASNLEENASEGGEFAHRTEERAGEPGLEQAGVENLTGENKPTSLHFTFVN